MRFDILTLFPEMIENACQHSIISRAIDEGKISVNAVNPRDYTHSKHKKVDDTPYGGGAGMVLMCQPFLDALKSVEKKENSQTIILTPQGEPFNNKMAKEFAQKNQLIMICGHYEGFDERIFNWVDEKLSIGDYVLTGGEMPALIIMDAVCRFIPGVLGKLVSAEEDSFSTGMLEYPQYTRPVDFEGLVVPEVLRNGNHALINRWRRKKSLKATYRLRPDLLSQEVLDAINGKVPRDMKKDEKKFYAEVREELAQEDIEGE